MNVQIRARKLLSEGLCIWFTGLSGAGKTTLAVALADYIQSQGYLATVLDADEVRKELNQDLSFTDSERSENVRRIACVAKILADTGMIVLVTCIAPSRKDREKVRGMFPDGSFIEVFVDCPIEKCIERDVKGLYKQACQGNIPHMTGISSDYEIPLHPDIVVKTSQRPIAAGVQRIVDYLKKSINVHVFIENNLTST